MKNKIHGEEKVSLLREHGRYTGNARAIWFTLWSFLFCFANLPLNALTLSVSDDMSRSSASLPNSKIGLKKTVKVGTNKGLITYLKFDQTPLPSGLNTANIEKVVLKVYAKKIKPGGSVLVLPIAADWTQSDVTAPAVLESMSVAGEIKVKKGFAWIDVTRLVRAQLSGEIGNYGLAIKGNGTTAFLMSKEAPGHEATLEIVLASDLNAVTISNLPPIPAVSVRMAAVGQQVTANVLTTPFFTGPEEFDNFNMHSVLASEFPERLTAAVTGYYRVTLEVNWIASVDRGDREIQILENGMTMKAQVAGPAAAIAGTSQIATTLIRLTAGQWVEARVLANTPLGGTTGMNGRFMMNWEGPF